MPSKKKKFNARFPPVNLPFYKYALVSCINSFSNSVSQGSDQENYANRRGRWQGCSGSAGHNLYPSCK